MCPRNNFEVQNHFFFYIITKIHHKNKIKKDKSIVHDIAFDCVAREKCLDI